MVIRELVIVPILHVFFFFFVGKYIDDDHRVISIRSLDFGYTNKTIHPKKKKTPIPKNKKGKKKTSYPIPNSQFQIPQNSLIKTFPLLPSPLLLQPQRQNPNTLPRTHLLSITENGNPSREPNHQRHDKEQDPHRQKLAQSGPSPRCPIRRRRRRRLFSLFRLR
jgi:hypothetical protein